jgi:ABC-type transport system involved in cytochrome c biogenesis permease subunit
LAVLLAPLASLRLTVALLALSIVLVLAGTLAQIDHDVSYVVTEYFRAWNAWIPLEIFFPRQWTWPEGLTLWFPGGKTIGLALSLNLLAAHGLRFKIAARGRRLAVGAALVLGGVAVTWAVVASGSNNAIESELSPAFCRGLWHTFRAALGGLALALCYAVALTRHHAKRSPVRWLWRLGFGAAVLLAGLSGWLFTHPSIRLGPSELRILWQLAKAAAACGVLGAGCWLTFGKRAGVVLLHGGIALLMLSELLTALYAVESQMRLEENQTGRFSEDMRSVELAITDVSDPLKDRTVVVPQEMLQAAAKSGDVLSHDKLPFDLRVVEYLPNAETRLRQPGEESRATAGTGALRTADAVDSSTGVGAEQAFDIPAIYVELLGKAARDGGKNATPSSHGVYLLAPFRSAEVVADQPGRQLSLRFVRVPKPYELTLIDFKHELYEGTETPKNFESVVRFHVPEAGVDRRKSISMNNPLRYAGDTIYQSSFDPTNDRVTILQIVTNSGWMVPYVACVIIAAGMLVHFTIGLVRFVSRREEESRRHATPDDGAQTTWGQWLRRPAVLVPLALVALMAAMVASHARPRTESFSEPRIREFGALPVAYGGRTQPLDSLARLVLRTISGKESYEDSRLQKKQPAIRWLLDVASQSPAFARHKVIRVENLDVLEALDLKPREGFRYSLAELLHDVTEKSDGELQRQAGLAGAVPKENRDLVQQKFLEANAKVQQILMLRSAFNVPDFGQSADELLQNRQAIERAIAQLNAAAPRIVPPATPGGPWSTIFESTYQMVRQAIVAQERPAADNPTSLLVKMFDEYKADEASEFNATLAEYQKVLAQRAAAEAAHEAELAAKGQSAGRKPAERLNLDRIAFESWFNAVDPLFLCWIIYLTALVFGVAAWIGWPEGFARSANWLLWLGFALHTAGLVCRIYISGRPPVTNLYSSAVFIGWGAVGISLLFEAAYRNGLGNVLAAAIGFPTLVIAHYLSFDGDTLGVMQAVLDTNFWLATHVVCITLGYAATFLAGGFGLASLVGGEIAGKMSSETQRQVARMTYGTLCFAIFLSFVGTILGGLWADDSWGRFWGWDPKENGALMIVLWNAIVLHARWGKLAGPRGVAALAVAGNIVTAWSWFGVNQLGVGLHAYGFTEGRTLAIALFVASQLAVIVAAYGAPLLFKGNETSASAATR